VGGLGGAGVCSVSWAVECCDRMGAACVSLRLDVGEIDDCDDVGDDEDCDEP